MENDVSDTQTRIHRIVHQCLAVADPADITDAARLQPNGDSITSDPNLGADSLDMVELVMATEEEFGVEILDADAEKIVTVGDLIALVDRVKGSPADA